MEKETKNQEDLKGKIKIDKIGEDVAADRKAHKNWYTGKQGYAKSAYEYYETNQVPSNFPSKLKVYSQINRVKESQDTRMGILLSSDPEWIVTGRGKDFKDRERAKIVKATMNWVGEESKLFEILNRVLFDYTLPGMGHVRPKWNQYTITKMDTMGMVELDWLPISSVKADADGRLSDWSDCRRVFFEKFCSKKQFMDSFGFYLESKGIKFDIDKIFDAVNQKSHWDYSLNRSIKNADERIASILDYQYWRVKPVKIHHPQTNEVITDDKGNDILIPKKEFRIALVAGDDIFEDYVSPFSDLGFWTIITFYNAPIHNLPYSQSDFMAEREIQDLLNTLTSLTINAQVTALKSPWMAYKSSIDKPEMWKEDSDADVLEWDAENIPAHMNPEYARPMRAPYGQIDPNMMKIIQMLYQMFEHVSVREVLKGQEPKGAKSGVAINLLQQTGLLPSNYHRHKLSYPLERLGMGMWELVRKNMTDEVELPVKNESGEPDGIKINEVITPQKMHEMVQKIQAGGENARKLIETLKMITIRDGDERLTVDEWAEGRGNINELVKAESEEKGRTRTDEEKANKKEPVQYVANDLSFGNFNVKLDIDPMAEQTRIERMQRVETVAPMIQGVGAVMTAIEWVLKVADDPDKDEIMRKIKEELQQSQQINQVTQGGQQ